MRHLLAALFVLTNGPVQAAFISEDFVTTPLVLTLQGPSSSISLDLNGDGTPDITLASTQGQSIFVAAGTSGVSWSGFYATPFASTAAFTEPASSSFTTAAAPIVNIINNQLSSDWPVDPGFLEIAFTPNGTQTIGYVDTYLALDPITTNATLTIQDYGSDTPIPEPASAPILLAALSAVILCATRPSIPPCQGKRHRSFAQPTSVNGADRALSDNRTLRKDVSS